MGWREILFGTKAAPDEFAVQGPDLSISDPALAAWLGRTPGMGDVGIEAALSIPAYWRARNVIAGTLAGLPLKTWTTSRDGTRSRTSSFLDNPAGPYAAGGMVPYTWKVIVFGHLLDHGETFLEHVYNGAGALVGLLPTNPTRVIPTWTDKADKVFKVTSSTGTRDLTSKDMTHVMAFTLDGLRGLSPLELFVRTIRTSIAGEAAAAKSFKGANKVLLSTLEDVEATDAKLIKDGLDAELADETSRLAFVNRQLKLDRFEMTQADAQFIESRNMQVEEWARVFGDPTNLLSVQGAVSNWGTGVAEANLSWQKYTLGAYTTPLEEGLTRMTSKAQHSEFDYKGLLQGTPAQEIALVIDQVEAGLMSPEYAQRLLNLPAFKPLKPKVVAPPTPIKEAS